MTMGPDNFGTGVPKNEDRFATQLGQYRPGSRRDGTRTMTGEVGGSELSSRNGASALDSRNGASVLDATAPIASSIAAKRSAGPAGDASSLAGHFGPREPERESWFDTMDGSLTEHPLLRGLLMELPPKGAVPDPAYLDRWFEAARSILDLLYTMNARP
jgi:hypothetical protein